MSFLTHSTLFNTLFWILTTCVFANDLTTIFKTSWMIEEKPGLGWDLATFNSFFFFGGSFDVQCESKGNNEAIILDDILTALKGMDYVANVWQIDLPENESEVIEPEDDKPPLPLPENPEEPLPSSLPSGVPPRRRTTSPKMKTRQPWDKRADPPASPEPTFAPHSTTGIDKLHKEGLKGQGIRIAIIDGDFNHEGMSAFSKTTIAHQYSIVDGGSNLASVPADCPEGDHGTKILSILGANSDNPSDRPLGLVGVAPEASYELIQMVRCAEQASHDKMIAGLIHAADRGVDIISLSYGAKPTYNEDPVALTVQRIAASGILVSVAVGNRGRTDGIWDIAASATGVGAVALGSTDNTNTPYLLMKATLSDGSTVQYSPGKNFELTGRPLTVWFPSNAELLPEGCNVLPEDASEIPAAPEDTILMIDVLHCWLSPDGSGERLTAKLGIRNILYYLSSKLVRSKLNTGQVLQLSQADNRDKAAHFVTVTFKDFGAIRRRMWDAKRGPLTITFPSESYSDITFLETKNIHSGDYMSSLSSWGPTIDGRLGPNIVAPGGDMLVATPPIPRGGLAWDITRGTSMSTPYYAGAAALIKQKMLMSGRRATSQEIQAAIATTALPRDWCDRVGNKKEFIAPVFQQGAGRLQAFDAAQSQTLISTTALNFNDTKHRQSLTFEISHLHPEPKEYTMTHLPAASGYILEARTFKRAVGDIHDTYATVEITPGVVTIAPGESATITVTVTKEPGLPDIDTRGVYFGGYIIFFGPGQVLSLPYGGFAGELKELPMVDQLQTKLVGVTSEDIWVEWTRDQTFFCNYDITVRPPLTCQEGVRPGVFLKTTIPSGRYLISIIDFETDELKVELNVVEHPATPFPRSKRWAWTGYDDDTRFLPPGRYFFRVMVLRMHGYEMEYDDYEIWESPTWYLEYAEGSTIPDGDAWSDTSSEPEPR
ncbi:hypothetical protein HYFRA_00009560 [Hymenoscyphus fraxineus]|uniref:Subtilisin-like protein n=1 Tax=Hymenoscyphus fraxineus TaxID=746836 RepID=A0A9N9KYX6_9HELO|nr:hypothetical protein HYFRA_00009560 [Hymenoscyphus fraxineus]